MQRIIVLLSVIVIGAAAPAKAWCEASCLAPQPQTQSHCPTHEPSNDATAISTAVIVDCPALDSARPPAPARLDAQAPAVAIDIPAPRLVTATAAPLAAPHSAITVFERGTPLRI